jgi:hypothetical protein
MPSIVRLEIVELCRGAWLRFNVDRDFGGSSCRVDPSGAIGTISVTCWNVWRSNVTSSLRAS